MDADSLQPSLPKDETTGDKQPSINSSLVLLSLAALGTITFIVVASSFPFKQEGLQSLYQKSSSYAASPVIFLDAQGNPIQYTSLSMLRIRLTHPWRSSQTVPQGSIKVFLAEDSAFSQNVNEYTLVSDTLVTEFFLSDSQPGVKTIYAKFIASDGKEYRVSKSIEKK